MSKINDIEDLIQAVNEKFGLEPFNNNFPPITEGLISQATVARMWKYPDFRERAVHPSTLDILARCIGYDSFKSFQQYKKSLRKVHKAADGTIFTLFNKHQELLNKAIEAFDEAGYITKESGDNKLRWIKEPWMRQEFACWITELCYLLEADKEEDYKLIKHGTFCEVSAQTFLASFVSLPQGLRNDNLREAVSKYRKQITHIHPTDLSAQYTHDELYRLSSKEVIKHNVQYWNEYDNEGRTKKHYTFKRSIYLPILTIFDMIR